ncbi:MAG: hypothetical protein K0R61_3490 [Microvirga sp.]|jgi:hypothetical protein|nr:hypothetical protein [Microvirga sp.]
MLREPQHWDAPGTAIFYRALTMLRFAISEAVPRRAIIMARTAPEKSNFFMRCNYEIEAPREVHGLAVRQEQSMKAAAQTRLGLRHAFAGLLGAVDQALDEIGRGDHADVALRRLWASLTEIKALRARDPGLRMAAQDLYEAAAALVSDRHTGAEFLDIRRWRLLKEADKRLKARLDNSAGSDLPKLVPTPPPCRS